MKGCERLLGSFSSQSPAPEELRLGKMEGEISGEGFLGRDFWRVKFSKFLGRDKKKKTR